MRFVTFVTLTSIVMLQAVHATDVETTVEPQSTGLSGKIEQVPVVGCGTKKIAAAVGLTTAGLVVVSVIAAAIVLGIFRHSVELQIRKGKAQKKSPLIAAVEPKFAKAKFSGSDRAPPTFNAMEETDTDQMLPSFEAAKKIYQKHKDIRQKRDSSYETSAAHLFYDKVLKSETSYLFFQILAAQAIMDVVKAKKFEGEPTEELLKEVGEETMKKVVATTHSGEETKIPKPAVLAALKAITPKLDGAKPEAPKSETPKSETPKADTPKADTPKQEKK